jgi:hypothetical protein
MHLCPSEYAQSRRRRARRTVYGKVPECGTSGSLNLYVGAVEKEEDRHKGISIDFQYV